MNLQSATNLQWANAEHTRIDMVIRWDTINEDLPFTADPNDSAEHGRAIYAAAVAGQFGPVAPYVAPPPPPPIIITSVTMRQARLALHRAGLLSQVNAAITDPEAQIEWEYAQTVERHSALVSNLSAGLGLDDIQLDNLFTLASTL